MNEIDKFLSPEWLDFNLDNAACMPEDHPVTITGGEWFGLLNEINGLRLRREKVLNEILADTPPDIEKQQAASRTCRIHAG